MFYITDKLWIEEATVTEKFVAASGPGGQHVNKNATAVQLRFDVSAATTLPEYVRDRLRRIAGSRLAEDGSILIQASQSRSQVRNRQEAWDRLAELIRQAAVRPKKRKATKPTKASQKRRVEKKRKRSQVKSLRRSKIRHDD